MVAAITKTKQSQPTFPKVNSNIAIIKKAECCNMQQDHFVFGSVLTQQVMSGVVVQINN